MSEPVDLTGMTKAQARRAVNAAAKTMAPQKASASKALAKTPYSAKSRSQTAKASTATRS